ncbi:MAG: parB-like partition protein [Gemmatimonadetes bacterium]|jgi:ParB family chromosome partitioning protein|nr:parB-like partition protein [Gemmatimonadota bacterium]
MPTEKPRRLGKGLDALLAARVSTPPVAVAQDSGESLRPLAIDQIRPNPFQPRKEFRPEDLAELEASLRSNGLLQAITVRPAADGRGFELIAGERRLRAATRLGWKEIPAVIKEIDDRALLTLALVENLQRADLNPIEEGEGYQRLIADFALTQQEVADIVGKDRSTIANMLRLLNLPVAIRTMVRDGHLTVGHARALLAVSNERDMLELAREIVAKGLTVRDVEQRTRAAAPTSSARTARQKSGERPSGLNAELKRLQDELRRHLQTDVTITVGDHERGKIEIAFYSSDDLDRVLDLVLASRERI